MIDRVGDLLNRHHVQLKIDLSAPAVSSGIDITSSISTENNVGSIIGYLPIDLGFIDVH